MENPVDRPTPAGYVPDPPTDWKHVGRITFLILAPIWVPALYILGLLPCDKVGDKTLYFLTSVILILFLTGIALIRTSILARILIAIMLAFPLSYAMVATLYIGLHACFLYVN